MTQSKNGPKNLIDISPKKTYGCLTNTWKNAQHHSLSEKCKSRPQWGTISHQSEWLRSKSLQAINAGEDVEKREPSYIAGGNVNGGSHYGRAVTGFFKTLKIELLHPTPGHVSGENHNSKRYIHPNVPCSTIFNCQ